MAMQIRGFFKSVTINSQNDKPVVSSATAPSVRKKQQSTGISRVKNTASSALIKSFDCSTCGLDKKCISPFMEVIGEGEKGILIIGEAPDRFEDEQGKIGIGDAFSLLQRKLYTYDIDLNRDCWYINSVNCSTPENREPTSNELNCCWVRVEKVILEKQPKFIWLMGVSALDSFYSTKDVEQDKVKISSWTKLCIPDSKYNCWVLPQYSHSLLVKNRDANFEAFFDLNLKFATSCLYRKPPIFDDWDQYVEVLTEFTDVIAVLKRVLEEKPKDFIFDYETNSKAPYYDESKVLSLSFWFDSKSYSFPFNHKIYWTTEQLQEITVLWQQILSDPEILKSAHNLKFEHKWSKIVLKTVTQGWKNCTMNNQHILDSRSGITSLKLQAFLRWNVPAYDREIKPYMQEVNGTHFNNLEEFPLDKLLHYGSLDSLFEHKLELEQEKEFSRIPSLDSCRKFYTEGVLALCDMEDEGIPVDYDYYVRTKQEIENERKLLITLLQDSKEAQEFERIKGKKLSLGASGSGLTNDVKYLILDILKVKTKKVTAKKGLPSVDDKALMKSDNQFCKNLLRARKLKKMEEYVDQYVEGIIGKRLHPSFNLNVAETGRSNSANPNFQNIPKRDEQAKRAVRSGIRPEPGYELMEADFHMLEVCGNTFYSVDPNLVFYCENLDADMHRDLALELFMLEQIGWDNVPKDIKKPIRQLAKNSVVFPFFYGDYFVACAQSVWEQLQEEKDRFSWILSHLASNNITKHKQFEEHVRRIENSFWSKYSVLKEWRESINEFYRRRGYVDSFFGFRRSGYIKRNQVGNAPVQGTCFHLLLQSAIWINNEFKKRNLKSKLVGQIHDAIVAHVWKEEKQEVREIFDFYMTKRIREVYKWICVPLNIDVDFFPDTWFSAEEKD